MCGIVGVFGDPEASKLSYLGLFALQHRGQEACGIASINGDNIPHVYKSTGLVGDKFKPAVLERIRGDRSIGHVRYSTAGSKQQSSLQEVQPFIFSGSFGAVAVAHNGNLTNAVSMRAALEKDGSIFQSNSDSEIFMHLIARSKASTILESIFDSMRQVKGAYALIILTPDRMFAIRDIYGMRPLSVAKKGDAVVVASETCAFD
jgi:amidophosphoribosyltransferase